MARKKGQQQSEETAATSQQDGTEESAADGDSAPVEQPAAAPQQPAVEAPQFDTSDISLKDALHRLTSDNRMKAHWESSIRKYADNHGVGKTASITKWKEILTKYGVKLK